MKKIVGMGRRGFTLIEVIVVAAIIAILAGILVPMIFNQIDESKVAKAKGDVKSIQSAIMLFKKDTGLWPNRVNGADPTAGLIETLGSDGNIPTEAAGSWNLAAAAIIPLIEYVGSTNTHTYPSPPWKGSYLASVPADPWGNKYIIGADNFEGASPSWIVSAGPNGTVETGLSSAVCFDGIEIDPATSAVTVGDDICLRIK